MTGHFYLFLNYMVYTVFLIFIFNFLRQRFVVVLDEDHRNLFFKGFRFLTGLTVVFSVIQVMAAGFLLISATVDLRALLTSVISLVVIAGYTTFVVRYLQRNLIQRLKPIIPVTQWPYHQRQLRFDLWANAVTFSIMFAIVAYAVVDFFLNVQTFF
jgi:uncharacterized membrane protein YqjE